MRIEKLPNLPCILYIGILSIVLHCNTYASVISDTARINKILSETLPIVETEPEKTDSLVTIALKLSEKAGYSEGIAKSKFIIATIHRIANHNVPAIENYFQSLVFYEQVEDSSMLQDIYQWLGLCLAFESYYDSGAVFIDKSIAIAQKLNQPGKVAQAYLNLARLHKSQGRLKKAIDDCNLALTLCNTISENEIRWKTENFLGYVYLLSNKQREAALIINKNLGEYKKYLHLPVEVYRLLFYGSLIDMYLNNYEKVLRNQNESLKIARMIPNKNLSNYFIAMSNELIGKAFIKKEKFDSAKFYLLKAYNNPEYLLDLHAKGEILFNLGDVYFHKYQNDSALHFFYQSAEIQARNKNPMYLSWSYLGIGKTYFQMKEYKNAEKYLLLSVNSDILNENIEIVSEASELLSTIYFSRNDFKNAYTYHKIFKEASDELFNRDKIRQLTQLELENEFGDREQQLKYESQQEKLVLETSIRQNKIIRNFTAGGLIMAISLALLIFKGYRQKKKSDSEKEILLKEIHHRVKNNLQIISSMLSLQGSYLSDQKIKDAVVESQGRVKSMALIHQMLYQNEKFSSIDIKEYIGQLVGTISSSFYVNGKNITTDLNIEQIAMDIDTAIPLGLIINELLTNAYKYAFPNGSAGLINVDLKRTGNTNFELVVRDNGVGLPENLLVNRQSKSLGLNMVNILTRQLKGELKATTENGTQFTIRFSEIIKHQN